MYKVQDEPCYVINLARHTHRKQHILENLLKNHFTRIRKIEAVDGTSTESLKRAWSFVDAPIDKSSILFQKSTSRQGCFLSHVSALYNIIATNRAACIFEDDATFCDGFTELWSRIQENFLPDLRLYDIIFLGHNADIAYRRSAKTMGPLWIQVPVFNAHAYWVTPHGALKILQDIFKNGPDAIDILYKRMILNHDLRSCAINRAFFETHWALKFPQAGRRETGIIFQNRSYASSIDWAWFRWIEETFL